ncbi:MAG: LSU ribosomal protein L18p (L5e) [Candidatus Bipolaricaulis sibiricus]|uniref:Large ribosomal subunit protein uL18 n=1 Tax=Bipolaricaulis sibiricus TaxID=2501609 RepID=A0A410FU53_BIPS1|nr:MAG: LSU ribosomal protein L18p (L5e) [Candidatus Bipolaricaulis sibiricus]
MAIRTRNEHRLKRKARIRRRVHGTADRPRLAVYKSLHHVYAQIVDDDQGKTLASASTLCAELRARGARNTVEGARAVGALVAQRAREGGIRRVVFDRSGYPYHGKVRALAEAAREGGLEF